MDFFFFIQVNNPFNIILAHMKASAPEANSTDCCFVITRSFHGCVPGVGLSPALATSETSELLVSNVSVMSGQTCADPEIFMRGGPTKMVIFGNRRGGWGGPTPQKSRNYLFLGKIFKFQGRKNTRHNQKHIMWLVSRVWCGAESTPDSGSMVK